MDGSGYLTELQLRIYCHGGGDVKLNKACYLLVESYLWFELESRLNCSLESNTTGDVGWGGRVGKMQNKAKLRQLRQWLWLGLS